MSVLIVLFLTAILVLFSGVFEKGKYARYIGILGLIVGLGISFLPECEFFAQYKSMYDYSYNAALFTKVSIVVTTLLFFLGGFAFSNHRSHQSELYALMLFALCGGIVLFGFQNLVTLFIGIEILSIPLYVMAGANKTDLRSTEASMKYFLMGAFATGFLLFGVALVYGSAGSFDLYAIHDFAYNNPKNLMLIMGAILMLSALAFKVSLAPFHMWSPDVYQGSPSLITAFMASVVKISGFFALFKLMTIAFGGIAGDWINILGVFIILTLLLANVMGLVQTNAKRMLAYSSVSHAGYISLIFFGINNFSTYILGYYLFAYSLATVGVFISLIWVEKIKKETSFAAFNGLGKREPLLAVVSTVSMLSMAGIPLTAGFIGKLGIFNQAVAGHYEFLVLIAVLGSALSIAYYLRLIIAMFFYKEDNFHNTERASITYNIVSVVIILALVSMGIVPDIFAKIFGL
ncbi:NADH-quinone oxidoreductase subunit N [Epilithonimonas hungarica]|uniref:NADH-quinone oxidoreductase subunit N n=1 Tax=Epilithonimonas hungarica TaxID=454006 RepID=A0A1G7I357_9FLAO|nr:NADH-quinone oxidoreductase subunit N [Epilithonimonas hungarica]SDF07190.1 NADH-quinone oxidoreductase subunit N [Epilithonimonas hungarica]